MSDILLIGGALFMVASIIFEGKRFGILWWMGVAFLVGSAISSLI